MPDLSLQKTGQRLRIYIGESDRWRNQALDEAILETLRAHGVAGATIFRGMAGFGAASRIRSARIEVLSMDLPVVIEVVDSPEEIAAVLEIIYPMVREGLITREDVQIVKYTHRFLNPLPADRLVSEVMTRPVVSIVQDATVHEAWLQMLQKEVKVLPVIDRSGVVVGILTDEDLLERAGLQQRLSVARRLERAELNQDLQRLEQDSRKVATVMTQPAVTITASEALGIATARMVKAGLKRLPVVDGSGKLVGMLSRLDILRQVAQTHPVAHAEEKMPPHAGQVVGEIMSPEIPMVHQDEDLSAVIEKFAASSSHRLIVVDGDGKAVGLISDSDVVARVQPARRKNILEALRQIGKPAPGKETAFELMSAGPLTAAPNLPVVEAIQLMLTQSRKWLVVVDERGKPLGLVTRELLLESLA
jgi:CBS domain-containing protein